MSNSYTDESAAHYAAYRPPLHQRILARAIPTDIPFSVGLDVGCGTGVSSLALASVCDRVLGTDPSSSMLEVAAAHERIEYRLGSAENLPVENESIDLASFAGSLFYTDVEKCATELHRVCRQDAWIVVYDFGVRFEPVLHRMGIQKVDVLNPYNHEVNFSDIPTLQEHVSVCERMTFEAQPSEIAHLVLADSGWRESLEGLDGKGSRFAQLTEELAAIRDHFTLESDVYYASYQLVQAAEPMN